MADLQETIIALICLEKYALLAIIHVLTAASVQMAVF